MQLWTADFTSDRFPPFLPEICQVNNDLYGFELATWLAQTLAGHGLVTSYPHAEEWGWFLEGVSEDEQELMVGCASKGATHGYPTDWCIFVRQRRKPRKGGADASPDLIAAILSALAAEGIEVRQS